MSISGLHVTMVAGLAFAAIAWAWRRIPAAPLSWPTVKAATLGGWIAAFGYSLLAGFAVPTQRTLYMLSVAALALLTGRSTSPSRVLAAALGLVLLRDPWAVIAPGFWLSFGAVGVLFYVAAGRIGRTGWLAEWGRTQWAVTLGMIPLVLALFQQFSLVSPFANALAIPVVSLLVTPLALLGAVIPLDPILWLAHAIQSVLMRVLEAMAGSPAALWQQAAPSQAAVALGVIGVLALLLPRGMSGRWLGLAMVLPMLFPSAPRPAPGSMRVTVLDVGQGTAVHVQTATRDLLYDTGPQFSAEANSGNRIIVPYLRAAGVTALDGLVVSHDDIDHSGGAASVLAALPVSWLLSSLGDGHPLASQAGHRSCAAGQAWEWDGVRFEVLNPPPARAGAPAPKANDRSCVLRVSQGSRAVLLAGDAEAPAELEMLGRGRERLASDVLVVGHHGSRTSSAAEFLDAVAPRIAVIPVGYRSRFRHPHPETLARLGERGATVLRTDRDGAVSIDIDAQGVRMRAERGQRRRYWHGA